MKNPREFWIWDSVDGTRKVSDYDPGIECFHVIEKSAYDKALADMSNSFAEEQERRIKAEKMADKLVESLKNIESCPNKDHEYWLTKSVDEANRALRECGGEE